MPLICLVLFVLCLLPIFFKQARGVIMKKVGIIRCQQTEDLCVGSTDFKIAVGEKVVLKNLVR